MSRLLPVMVCVLAACGGGGSERDAVGNEVAQTTAPTAVGVSNAEVRAGVVSIIQRSRPEQTICPFGEVGPFGSAAGYAGTFVSTEVLILDERIRCGASSTEEPSTTVTISAYLDLAPQADYLANTNFMVTLEPFDSAGGLVTVVCPHEQTVGDTPEQCEAFWFADGTDVAIKFSVSAASVDIAAVATGFTAVLDDVKTALAAG